MIDKETKEFRPVTAFLNAEQLAKDVASVNDAARGKVLSVVGVALALLRNYNPMEAPSTFKLTDLLQKFDKCFGATGRNYGKVTGDRTFDDIEKRRTLHRHKASQSPQQPEVFTTDEEDSVDEEQAAYEVGLDDSFSGDDETRSRMSRRRSYWLSKGIAGDNDDNSS